MGGKRRVGVNYRKKKKTLKEIISVGSEEQETLLKATSQWLPKENPSPVQICTGW